MALQEIAAYGDLVGRGQAVRVLRAHVAALDLDPLALHDPKFAVAVKARARPVKALDVRIAPEHARPAPGRGRGPGRPRRPEAGRLHGRGGRGDGPEEDHADHDGQQASGPSEVKWQKAPFRRHDGKITGSVANVLVRRLKLPIPMTRTDEGQLAVVLPITDSARCARNPHANATFDLASRGGGARGRDTSGGGLALRDDGAPARGP
mmetsp:Transcript_113062/g.359244  ORF Transcript_113062/g.359244 Transcript_113062/m.359244 type:complete len:207 (+) Transcript_113062:719-1339(+)